MKTRVFSMLYLIEQILLWKQGLLHLFSSGLQVDGVESNPIEFFLSNRRRHTRLQGDWSSDVCSSDLALVRLSEIAAAQELLADARAHLRKLWELRSERGDDDAAAECLVRLAALPEADVETKLTGGRAARMLGETQRAAELFRSAAEELEEAGRSAAALDARAQVVALDPADVALRRQVVTQYVAAGQMDEAGQLLNTETAGADPELLLALASLELARRDDGAGCATLTRLIDLAPDRVPDVLRLAGDLGRAGEAERAFACSSVVVDAAVRRADWDRAIDVLQSFLVHGAHVPALVRLVQVSEDAGAEEILNEAQERLLATYLD